VSVCTARIILGGGSQRCPRLEMTNLLATRPESASALRPVLGEVAKCCSFDRRRGVELVRNAGPWPQRQWDAAKLAYEIANLCRAQPERPQDITRSKRRGDRVRAAADREAVALTKRTRTRSTTPAATPAAWADSPPSSLGGTTHQLLLGGSEVARLGGPPKQIRRLRHIFDALLAHTCLIRAASLSWLASVLRPLALAICTGFEAAWSRMIRMGTSSPASCVQPSW
jgi:hypothetical protein